MSVVNEPGMSEERFAVLIGAYGANPARWPAAERDAAERLLRSSTSAQALAAEARRLDQSLVPTGPEPVPASLEHKLLADFARVSQRPSLQRVLRGAAEFVWPGAPAWQPAFALALALAVGLGIAALTPLEEPHADSASVGVFALDGTPDIDAGQGI
jgi:hypothetical protein